MELPYGLKYGATSFWIEGDEEYWAGDIDHYPFDDLLYNAETLRQLFKQHNGQFKKYKPWGMHKDIDKEIYMRTEKAVRSRMGPIVICCVDMARWKQHDAMAQQRLTFPVERAKSRATRGPLSDFHFEMEERHYPMRTEKPELYFKKSRRNYDLLRRYVQERMEHFQHAKVGGELRSVFKKQDCNPMIDGSVASRIVSSIWTHLDPVQAFDNAVSWYSRDILHPLGKVSSKRLAALMQMEHPNEHGEPYDRFQVMKECERRGKRLLEDLGWPTKPNALYYNKYSQNGEATTLEEICHSWRWSDFRRTVRELEDQLHLLTNDEFPDNVGLSCSTLKEWRQLVKKYPRVLPVLKDAVRLDKGFYEHVVSSFPRPIKEAAKNDSCQQNICALARWLGINVDKVEPLSSLPKPNIYSGVWEVVEHFNPNKPTKKELMDRCKRQVNRSKKPTQVPLTLF